MDRYLIAQLLITSLVMTGAVIVAVIAYHEIIELCKYFSNENDPDHSDQDPA
jgi:hypothetical protein